MTIAAMVFTLLDQRPGILSELKPNGVIQSRWDLWGTLDCQMSYTNVNYLQCMVMKCLMVEIEGIYSQSAMAIIEIAMEQWEHLRSCCQMALAI